MIGDSNVGKSCLLMRLLQSRFKNQHQPTLGVQFGSKIFNIKNKAIKLQIWDTAGQESFKSITRAYYKGSIAAILVYDITNQTSFQNLENWLYQLKNHSHQKIHIALVGNKADLSSEREVNQQRAKQFVKKHNIDYYFQTSALTGENVQKLFFDLGSQVLKKIDNGTINIDLDTAYGVKRGKKNPKKYGSDYGSINLKDKKSLVLQPQQNKCNC